MRPNREKQVEGQAHKRLTMTTNADKIQASIELNKKLLIYVAENFNVGSLV